MAVCGRCFLCGHKFSGYPVGDSRTDVAFEWICDRGCADSDGATEHKLCVGCHDRLQDGTIKQAVLDLMALLEARQDPG